MSTEYLDLLNSLLEDEEASSPDKLKGFLDETLAFFQKMQTQMKSEDPEERAKAVRTASEMKESIDSKLSSLAEKSGMDLSDLGAMLGGLSSDETSVIERVNNQFEDMDKDQKHHGKSPLSQVTKII